MKQILHFLRLKQLFFASLFFLLGFFVAGVIVNNTVKLQEELIYKSKELIEKEEELLALYRSYHLVLAERVRCDQVEDSECIAESQNTMNSLGLEIERYYRDNESLLDEINKQYAEFEKINAD